MIIKDGIAYADNEQEVMSVVNIIALDNYELKITFSNGEVKIFDFKPLLSIPIYSHLNDKSLFNQCYVDLGTVTWDSDTDISTDTLYLQGVSFSERSTS